MIEIKYKVGDTVEFRLSQTEKLTGVVMLVRDNKLNIKHGVDNYSVPIANIVQLVVPKPKL